MEASVIIKTTIVNMQKKDKEFELTEDEVRLFTETLDDIIYYSEDNATPKSYRNILRQYFYTYCYPSHAEACDNELGFTDRYLNDDVSCMLAKHGADVMEMHYKAFIDEACRVMENSTATDA